MSRGWRRLVALAAATAVGIGLPPAPVDAAQETMSWRGLLDRAAQAAEERAYVGEVLWITYEDDRPTVARFEVSSSGKGAISVVDRERYAVRLGDDGGGLAAYERGWFVPLPAADLAKAHKGLSRLQEKYVVEVTGTQHLLDKPCTTLEIRRRDDGELAERLWIDRRSELLVRRETYDGDATLLRLVSYLSLDLGPSGTAAETAPRGQRPTIRRRDQQVAEVDADSLAVLRQAGWTVPAVLPGDYRPDGSFTVAAERSQPLQVVYSDGLYTLSLFEQRGTPDLASLPPGAEPTDEYGFTAYTWPGAVPQRLVWEASGTTFSLVGDAPPHEFRAIVAALPQPQPDTLLARLRRGLSRLWSWMSPWS